MKKYTCIFGIFIFFLCTPSTQAISINQWFLKLFESITNTVIFRVEQLEKSETPEESIELENIASNTDSNKELNDVNNSSIEIIRNTSYPKNLEETNITVAEDPRDLPVPAGSSAPTEYELVDENAPIALSCLDLKNQGYNEDGIYMIDVDGGDELEPFPVYCDQNSSRGGWMLLVRRTDNRHLSIGLTLPSSQNVLNARLADATIDALEERFYSPFFDRQYTTVKTTLRNMPVDLQARRQLGQDWQLDVKIGKPDEVVDNVDACDSSARMYTARTKDPNIGFTWSSYSLCSDFEGFYGYAKLGREEDIRMEVFGRGRNYEVAELWVK